MQCDENKCLPALRPLPPAHYPGKFSMSNMFITLILGLAFKYEVMSHLVRS